MAEVKGAAQGKEKKKRGKPVSNWVIGPTAPIESAYKIGNPIGQPGQFGYAVEAKHLGTQELRAVKVVSKSRFAHGSDRVFHFKQLRAEIDVMRKMDHPNIIKFYEVFENQEKLYIVMEMCRGGELFDRIKDSGSYSEMDASTVLRQICLGLEYMHAKGIAHCDLKPDNFLFLSSAPDSPVKIIDFGMAKFVKSRKYFKSLCGTPYYVSPEVVMAQYNHHADMWSLGVVMFVMIYGYPPFYADPDEYGSQTDEKIFELIKRGFDPHTREGFGPYFPDSIPCSDSAKDLIAKLLTKNVAKRLTASEALEHPWLKGDTASQEKRPTEVFKHLSKLQKQNKLKAHVCTMMSSMLSDTEIERAMDDFKKIDADGNGYITAAELQQYSENHPEAADMMSRITNIIQAVDVDGDGQISYKEWVNVIVQRKLVAKEERLWQAFRQLDLDGDGHVTKAELEQVLKKQSSDGLLGSLSPQDVDEMIRQADKDGDGTVDYDEFVAIFRDQQEK